MPLSGHWSLMWTVRRVALAEPLKLGDDLAVEVRVAEPARPRITLRGGDAASTAGEALKTRRTLRALPGTVSTMFLLRGALELRAAAPAVPTLRVGLVNGMSCQ